MNERLTNNIPRHFLITHYVTYIFFANKCLFWSITKIKLCSDFVLSGNTKPIGNLYYYTSAIMCLQHGNNNLNTDNLLLGDSLACL